tara:strand:+ start:658 stop:828 length:171 start_codon:yes stop_codon:yes gene_type:complete
MERERKIRTISLYIMPDDVILSGKIYDFILSTLTNEEIDMLYERFKLYLNMLNDEY